MIMYKPFLPLLLALLVFTSCKKETTNPYPDCFNELNETSLYRKGGCGNLFVTAWLDSAHVITFSMDGNGNLPSQTCSTVDLGQIATEVSVNYQIAGSSADSSYFNFCTDVLSGNEAEPEIWPAVSGTLTFAMEKLFAAGESLEAYKVSLWLKNAVFESETNPGGPSFTISEMVIKDVTVGWLPG